MLPVDLRDVCDVPKGVCLYEIPRLRTKFSERASSFSGPSAWNALPPDIRDETSTATFRTKLKTQLRDTDLQSILTVINKSHFDHSKIGLLSLFYVSSSDR